MESVNDPKNKDAWDFGPVHEESPHAFVSFVRVVWSHKAMMQAKQQYPRIEAKLSTKDKQLVAIGLGHLIDENLSDTKFLLTAIAFLELVGNGSAMQRVINLRETLRAQKKIGKPASRVVLHVANEVIKKYMQTDKKE